MQIPGLFRSKRFWSAALGLGVIIGSASNPSLEPHLNVIVPGVLGLIGVLIGGYTVEQTAQAIKETGESGKPLS